MTLYKCPRCNYSTKVKPNIKTHFKRKFPCKPIYSNISVDILFNDLTKCIILPSENDNNNIKNKKIKKTALNSSKLLPNAPKCSEMLQNIPNENLQKSNKIEPVLVEPVVVEPVVEPVVVEPVVESVVEPVVVESVVVEPVVEEPNQKSRNNSINLILDKKKIQCIYCLKYFSKNSNLTRHLKKSCKEKQNEDLLEIAIQEKKEIQQQFNNYKIINNNINTTNNTTNNTTHDHSSNINITLNSYGNENTKHIEPDYIMKLLQGVFTAVPKLIEKVHFAPECPENSNIKITNKKLAYASIYNNHKWELKDKDEFICQLMEDKYNLLEELYNEIESELNENARKLMFKFKNRYETLDEELMKKLKKNTEIIVLNNCNKNI